MEVALGSAREPRREAALAALRQHLGEQVVAAPLFDVLKPMAHRADLKGLDYGSTVLTMNLSRTRIDTRPDSPCSRERGDAAE